MTLRLTGATNIFSFTFSLSTIAREEKVEDESTWRRLDGGYLVDVPQSSPTGYTLYCRQVSIREDGKTFIRKMKTVNFLKRFEKVPAEQEATE